MHPTRRTWQAVGLGGVLAIVAVVAAQPAALLGVAGVGAWLLVTQFRTVQAFRRTADGLVVDVEPLRRSAVVEESVAVTVTVERPPPATTELTVTVNLPVTATNADVESRRLHLPPGETQAATTFRCSVPVAGRFELPPATVEVADRTGSFTETLTREVDERLTVQPRRPRNVHVGQGGEQVATTYGEHRTESAGTGLIPDEIRQYVPGDSLANIDWKATARHGSPHVREYEAETDRTTVLVVDHRASMGLGPEGERMLDYAREVAVGFARSARDDDDPLGLYCVGDEGITTGRAPVSSPQAYRTIHDVLYGLEPTSSAATPNSSGRLTRPSESRRIGQRLQGEDSPFARSVAPFLVDAEAYVHRIEGDPLFETLRRVQAETSGTVWTVVLTSDANRDGLRDAVRLATRRGNHATVFLTPRVLYERGAFENLERAYDRYVGFEQFRNALQATPRTTVYEVGPGDRLDALLARRQRSRP